MEGAVDADGIRSGAGHSVFVTAADRWFRSDPVQFSSNFRSKVLNYRAVSEFSTWAQGAKVAAGDFNNGGRHDIALTGGPGWWTVPVGFSNGDGTFRVTNKAID